jgi:outer membrane protein TolC
MKNLQNILKRIKRSGFKDALLFASLLIFSLAHSYGQVSDSLAKYLEVAAGKNPLVLQRFTEYKAALQKVPQAGSLSDPQLDIGIYLTPMELISGNQVADIKLMQMFPWFGVLRNARDEMSQMASAKFEQFRDAKLQVYYDVQSSWNDLYRIRKAREISERNLEILKIIERLALIKYKTAPAGSQSSSSSSSTPSGSSRNSNAGTSGGMQGMTGNQGANAQPSQAAPMQSGSMEANSGITGLSDVYRIQIESGDLSNTIELLKNQEQTATALFNSYLNRPPQTTVHTVDSLLPDSINFLLSAIPDSINAHNPMLKMIGYEKKSYDARKRMVTGMGYPMVGLGINYSIISSSMMSTSEMNGKDMIMPMVSVTLPIYRKKYNAMRKEAELMGDAADLNYQATANSLQTEYFRAVQLYQDASRRMKLNQEQFQLASRTFDIMLKSFSSTSTNLTDVLRVRQQMLDYELSMVQALTDLNTAAAGLRRLMATTNQ